MKDYSVIILLITFCFLFYFMCLFSLQQQTRYHDTDIPQIIRESCRHIGQIDGTNRDKSYKYDHHGSLSNDLSQKARSLQDKDGHSADDGYTGSPRTQSRDSQLRHRKPVRCPITPPDLRDTFDLYEQKTMDPVQYGGSYRPKHCRPTESVAIIVPYRDRKNQLDFFLSHMHSFLQKQQLEYTIFVVEMALPTQFNRGLLANVGFITADSSDKFSCFIFHDVDLLPLNETNLYRCSNTPRHMSVKNSKYNYTLPYPDYVGGVVSFRKNHFLTINGFSNLYFGWGAEDDDLKLRLKAANKSFERKNIEQCYYKALPHTHDSSNPRNPLGHVLVNQAQERMGVDGLNSVRYLRLALEFRELYTWVYVFANETETMQSYTHLRSPPWKTPSSRRGFLKDLIGRNIWLNSLLSNSQKNSSYRPPQIINHGPMF